MEANEFIQKVMPIIHGHMGKSSRYDEGINIYPTINRQMMSKISKQCTVDDDETFVYVYDLNAFKNGSTGGDVKDIVKGAFIGGTFGVGALFTNNDQYFFGLSNKGIWYRPNVENEPAWFRSWESIDKIVPDGLYIYVYTHDNACVRVYNAPPNRIGTGIHPMLSNSSTANMLNAILRVTIAEEQQAEQLLDDYYSTLSAGESVEDIEARASEFCAKLEREFATKPESIQQISLKMQANLNFRLSNTQKSRDNALQYMNRFGRDEEIDFIYGLAECELKAGTYGEYKNLKYLDVDTSNMITFTSRIADACRHDVVSSVLRNFLSYDYNDRRFLVIDSSMSYLKSNNFIVLPKDQLPKGIQFPIGHPVECEMYVCHPYKTNYYIPYETHEFDLFKDKMDELRLVLQTMGATSIRICDTNDSAQDKINKQHVSVDSGVNVKSYAVHVNADYKKSSDEYEKLRREYATESSFEPQGMPFIPDNLVWYPRQPDWQRLFEQRKYGMKTHKISVSVDQETKISTQKQLGLKADFQNLILKVNAGVNVDTDKMFETKTSSIWTLEVEFASLKELQRRENAAKGEIATTSDSSWTRFWRWIWHLFVK